MQINPLLLTTCLSLVSMMSNADESAYRCDFSNDYSTVTAGAIALHQPANRYSLDSGYQDQTSTSDLTKPAQLDRGENGSALIGDSQVYLTIEPVNASGIVIYNDNATQLINSAMAVSPTITNYNWPQQKIASYLHYSHAEKQQPGCELVLKQRSDISKARLGQPNRSNQPETTSNSIKFWGISINPGLQYIRRV